jgi:hypothetical protein
MVQRDSVVERGDASAWSVDPNLEPPGSVSWMLAVRGEGVATTHELPPDGLVTVGRGKEAAVSIRHPSLSRQHVRIHVGRFVTVQDLGSRHGTMLAGARLDPGEIRIVRPGDVLQLGAVTVTVLCGTFRRG